LPAHVSTTRWLCEMFYFCFAAVMYFARAGVSWGGWQLLEVSPTMCDRNPETGGPPGHHIVCTPYFYMVRVVFRIVNISRHLGDGVACSAVVWRESTTADMLLANFASNTFARGLWGLHGYPLTYWYAGVVVQPTTLTVARWPRPLSKTRSRSLSNA
jgi:hypothetical protein